MKSDMIKVTLTEEMVEKYEMIFGKHKSLPPSFPMIFYQFINVPWEYEGAPIHRKQKSFCQKELVIGEIYRCEVTLDRKVKRGNNLFYTQSLVGYDEKGEECFRCVSEFVVRLP